MPTDRPFSQACENNKRPILAIIRRYLTDAAQVLEIGSGTGQHAVFFAGRLPHLTWQTSDLAVYHAGIHQWLDDAALDNVLPPLTLDVTDPDWPIDTADAIFSANTTHIMSWSEVEAFIAGVGRILRPSGCFMLYGPFVYAGAHTSDSNARFDRSLRNRDPASGVRAFEAIDACACNAGLMLIDDHAMPANNRLLVWCKTAATEAR